MDVDLQEIGARCSLATCNRQDFLPYTCQTCRASFCTEHRSPASHGCAAAPSMQVPTCPLCSAAVPVPPNSTPDAAVSRHIDQGCPKRRRTAPVCSHPPCSKRDLSATTCPSCRRVFCLAHRLEADHACTAVIARPNVDPFGRRVRPAQPPKKPERPSGRARRAASAPRRTDFQNAPTAPVGDAKTPVEDRLTVAVFFPAGSGVQARYMFFSRRNSAGRIVDALLKDVQGLQSPPSGKRYSLYAVKRGGGGVNLLPHIRPLKDLGDGVVQNGDMLVLDIGEDGLDPEWIAALHKLSASSRLPTRRSFKAGKSSKCIVA